MGVTSASWWPDGASWLRGVRGRAQPQPRARTPAAALEVNHSGIDTRACCASAVPHGEAGSTYASCFRCPPSEAGCRDMQRWSAARRLRGGVSVDPRSTLPSTGVRTRLGLDLNDRFRSVCCAVQCDALSQPHPALERPSPGLVAGATAAGQQPTKQQRV